MLPWFTAQQVEEAAQARENIWGPVVDGAPCGYQPVLPLNQKASTGTSITRGSSAPGPSGTAAARAPTINVRVMLPSSWTEGTYLHCRVTGPRATANGVGYEFSGVARRALG